MKNIFVVGLEPFNLELLRTIDKPNYRFHGLLEYSEVVHAPEEGYPALDSLVDRAVETLASTPGGADAVIGYWDFPSSAIVPMIAQRMGWPGPTLEAVARCEHKYWSRLEQREVIPDNVPAFQAISPFDDDVAGQLELEYPFWIKPVKAHSSFLGFHIGSPQILGAHLQSIRQKIGCIGRPFNEFLAHVDVPRELAAIDGMHCIAEEIISAGFQCTLEGFVWQGEMATLGIVDSIRSGQHRSSFSRYQYPSKLPRAVRARMIEIARKVVRQLQYDGATFNIEFFWNPRKDHIWLLEINARISKSHSPLFLMVDGATNQKATLELALGRPPELPRRAGSHRLAAKFMLRYFEDGTLERVPGDDDIRRLQDAFPEARVRLVAPEGVRLSELKLQDSYSYEVAEIFLGADRQKGLLEKYQQALRILDFRVRPPDREAR